MNISKLICVFSNIMAIHGDLNVKIDSCRGKYGEEDIVGVVPTHAVNKGEQFPHFTGRKYLLLTSDAQDANNAALVARNFEQQFGNKDASLQQCEDLTLSQVSKWLVAAAPNIHEAFVREFMK